MLVMKVQLVIASYSLNGNYPNPLVIPDVVTNNNEIDYVTFTYGYMDEFSGEIFNGEVRATYKDVGVTENPAL